MAGRRTRIKGGYANNRLGREASAADKAWKDARKKKIEKERDKLRKEKRRRKYQRRAARDLAKWQSKRAAAKPANVIGEAKALDAEFASIVRGS